MDAGEYDLLDRLESRMWWYLGLHRQLAAALKRLAPAPTGGVLLDAGCGTGGLLRQLRDHARGLTRVGLEISPAAASRAAAKSGAAIVSGSVNAMPLADGSVAAIVSADVLCHARVAPKLALAEMRRVLAPGGVVVLNVPAYDWLRSAHDERVHNARRFTASGITPLLLAAGKVPVRTTYWNSFLLPVMLARRLLSRGGAGKSDVMEYPAALNALFGAVLTVERWLIALGLRLPAGGSLLVVARKNA